LNKSTHAASFLQGSPNDSHSFTSNSQYVPVQPDKHTQSYGGVAVMSWSSPCETQDAPFWQRFDQQELRSDIDADRDRESDIDGDADADKEGQREAEIEAEVE
jgi:hypothetical protein